MKTTRNVDHRTHFSRVWLRPRAAVFQAAVLNAVADCVKWQVPPSPCVYDHCSVVCQATPSEGLKVRRIQLCFLHLAFTHRFFRSPWILFTTLRTVDGEIPYGLALGNILCELTHFCHGVLYKVMSPNLSLLAETGAFRWSLYVLTNNLTCCQTIC